MLQRLVHGIRPLRHLRVAQGVEGQRCFSLALMQKIRNKDPNMKSGAETGALDRIREAEELSLLPEMLPIIPPPLGAVLMRNYNRPEPSKGSIMPVQIYPGHPHNYTPLRPIPHGFAAMDRAVRDLPWESRFDLLDRRIMPRYAGECPGTPRREIQDGLVAGIRVRPVQNPFVELKAAQRYRLNTWLSRNWTRWTPQKTHIRGSRRKYRIPEDISPYKDELGEWHPCRVSGRYKADIEKQYYMNSLPWVWATDYFQSKLHFMDCEPRGPKRWYKKEFKKAAVTEALRRADTMIDDYRKERRDKKRLSWVETIALEFAGEQLAAPFVRQRKFPKM